MSRKLPRIYPLCFLFLINLLVIGCNSKTQSEVVQSDSTETDTTAQVDNGYIGPAPGTGVKIEYESSSTFESFPELENVLALSAKAINVKDSIEMVKETQDLSDPADSAIFMPYMDKAYKAIMDYKQVMSTGVTIQGQFNNLLSRSRNADVSLLPAVEPSHILSDGEFFFLGGAPFIYQVKTDDGEAFTNEEGKPELHFATSVTENANYILNALYHWKKIPTQIDFGKPLDSYESGPQDIKGIGTLIHKFSKRIQAYFITTQGLIPAELLSVDVKLVPESLGCISDQPHIEFACTQEIDANDILAIYIPFETNAAIQCNVKRKSALWTADLNNDGIADIACLWGTFEGISSDSMAEVLWFVNNNGTWQVVDYGQELDCT